MKASTTLHLAALKGHLCVVEYLLHQGADINEKAKGVEFLFIMRLLFIKLLIKIILVLLNT